MPVLSDENLGLMLSELVNRPTIATVNASKNPALLKSLWSLLTVYQWTPTIQGSVDAAIRAAMVQPGLTSHVSAIALTRDALVIDPDFFPFCLSPGYWADAQRAHFRGLIGQTTYPPPSYYGALASDAWKVVLPVAAGAVVAAFLPEELVGGAVALAATKLAGRTLTSAGSKALAKMATGIGLAGGGMALGNALNGPTPGDAARQDEMWRRYQIEARRRAMPS